MPLPVDEVQRALKADGLDGWLLYDFQGSNHIATRLAGLGGAGKMTTRRWYYLIPAAEEPRALVHAIERYNLDELPGSKRVYSGRDQLAAGLKDMLAGMRRIAMEYSPGNAIPYISRVDAGTVEAVRQLGVDVVSSGDLVQRFEAVWTAAQYATHVSASDKLYKIKDQAFALIRERLASGASVTEFEVQQQMMRWFGAEGLLTQDEPNVSAQENSGNPHYCPTRERHRAINRDELVLLDLWGKLQGPDAVFADITWVGFTGRNLPPGMSDAFEAARAGRDAAVELVESAVSTGRDLRGFEVDRACRQVVTQAGFGPQFVHRTGHSLGTHVHGDGVHMDDYETHDDRRLLPGTGFTIEPGVYTDQFGVRTEINMFVSAGGARVTGPRQQEIVLLS
jgi:Xaa-Pro aminopeptidase